MARARKPQILREALSYFADANRCLQAAVALRWPDGVRCPGCGGKNPANSSECDWCGRPFVSKGGRLRITIWQVLSSLLLLGLIGAVAAFILLRGVRREDVVEQEPAEVAV